MTRTPAAARPSNVQGGGDHSKLVSAFTLEVFVTAGITTVALKVAAIWSERRYVDVSLLAKREVDQAV